MASAVRRLGSLSMARGCARIDAGPDTAKIGSADRVQVHNARLLAVIGVRKTFPHGLDPMRNAASRQSSASSAVANIPSHDQRSSTARPKKTGTAHG
jgi:hypothetical protein